MAAGRWIMLVDIVPAVDEGGGDLRMLPGAGKAVIGQPYRANANPLGGVPPYTVTNGTALPPGLSLNATTGEITGTPSGTPGYVETAFSVTDSAANVFSTVLGFTIVDEMTVVYLVPPAENGVAFSIDPSIVGGVAPYNFFSVAGPVPGLSVDINTGRISETPTTPGDYTWQIVVADTGPPGQTTTILLRFTVSDAVSIGGLPNLASNVGSYVDFTPIVTNGVAPFSFDVTTPLPAGLTIDYNSGRVSGFLSAVFSGSTNIRVTDFLGAQDTNNAVFSINQVYADAARAVVRTFAGNGVTTLFNVTHPFEDNDVLSVQVSRRYSGPSRNQVELVDCEWNQVGGNVAINFHTAPGLVSYDVVIIGNRGTP